MPAIPIRKHLHSTLQPEAGPTLRKEIQGCSNCGSLTPLSFNKSFTVLRCSDCGVVQGIYNRLFKKFVPPEGFQK